MGELSGLTGEADERVVGVGRDDDWLLRLVRSRARATRASEDVVPRGDAPATTRAVPTGSAVPGGAVRGTTALGTSTAAGSVTVEELATLVAQGPGAALVTRVLEVIDSVRGSGLRSAHLVGAGAGADAAGGEGDPSDGASVGASKVVTSDMGATDEQDGAEGSGFDDLELDVLLGLVRALEIQVQSLTAVQLRVVAAVTRRMAWQIAGERVLASAGAPTVDPLSEAPRRASDELSLVLGVSTASASRKVALAEGLSGLPATLARWERGRLSFPQAQAVVEETAQLDRAGRREVERRLWGDAGDRPTPPGATFRRTVTRLVAKVDADAVRERAARTRKDRTVQTWALPDANACLSATGPAEAVRVIWTALDHLADTLPTPVTAIGDVLVDADGVVHDALTPNGQEATLVDSRTVDQRRFDALHTLASAALTGDRELLDAILDDHPAADGGRSLTDDRSAHVGVALGTAARSLTDDRRGGVGAALGKADWSSTDDRPTGRRHGRQRRRFARARKRPPVQVVVTMPLAALAGLRDDPAWLDGYGPIPAKVARALAADADWRALFTSPDGRLAALDPRTYRPAGSLAEVIRFRDGGCRWPGCGRGAHVCEVDHTHPYDDGGLTTEDNLGCLCVIHHKAKHHTRWRLTQHEGVFTWTNPRTGEQVSVHPELYDSDPEQWVDLMHHIEAA